MQRRKNSSLSRLYPFPHEQTPSLPPPNVTATSRLNHRINQLIITQLLIKKTSSRLPSRRSPSKPSTNHEISPTNNSSLLENIIIHPLKPTIKTSSHKRSRNQYRLINNPHLSSKIRNTLKRLRLGSSSC